MTVYFIGGDFDAVKIGYTSHRNADSRLATLQTGNGHKLEVLALIPGQMSLEQKLHRRFEHCSLSGEWFRRTLELDSMIQWAKERGNISGWTFVGDREAMWKSPTEVAKSRSSGGCLTDWCDLFRNWQFATRNTASDLAHCEIIDRNSFGYQYEGAFTRRDGKFCWEPRSEQVTAIEIATGPDTAEWRAALWISIAVRTRTGGPRLERYRDRQEFEALQAIADAAGKIFESPWSSQMTHPLPIRMEFPRVDSMTAKDFVSYAATLRASLFADYTVRVFRNWKDRAATQ